MTKPRTRTHKIHRKRGPKRGFKSRSQRGGAFLDYFGLGNTQQTATESKQSWSDWIMGEPSGYTAPVEPSYKPQPTVYNPMQQAPVSQTNIEQKQPSNETNSFVYGGRRKCTKCKKHHKHSRKCKK